MPARSTVHASFTVERSYPYPPARVFRAFAQSAAREAWFGAPSEEATTDRLEFDFRVGGREQLAVQVKNGPAMT